jgi:hypothetical protein
VRRIDRYDLARERGIQKEPAADLGHQSLG